MSLRDDTSLGAVDQNSSDKSIIVHGAKDIRSELYRMREFAADASNGVPSHDPTWMTILEEGLGHTPYCIEAVVGNQCVALLPLCLTKSPFFGSHLVSLPYLNHGGVVGDVARDELIRAAADLADELDVCHLQLRNRQLADVAILNESLQTKIHMRLSLPDEAGRLWDGFKSKVRSQIRKAEKNGVTIKWGREDLIDAFYSVFSRNMRDLGTPVFPKRLFKCILRGFGDDAEICIGYFNSKAIAAAILVHGSQTTEVPSASSLRTFNWTNANMIMYWNLLERSIERHQAWFDFGRTTEGSATYRFKRQWGATPQEANWQYYVRRGKVAETRIESGRFDHAVRLWQRLPLPIANALGPIVVKGIP